MSNESNLKMVNMSIQVCQENQRGANKKAKKVTHTGNLLYSILEEPSDDLPVKK